MKHTNTRLEIENMKSNIWSQKISHKSILQNLPEKSTRLSEHINTKGTHKIQTFDLFIQRTKYPEKKNSLQKKYKK